MYMTSATQRSIPLDSIGLRRKSKAQGEMWICQIGLPATG